MPQVRPTVEPTRRTALVIAGVVGAGVSWIAFSLAESLGWPLPTVPVLSAVVVAALAGLTLAAARWTHRTVQVRREPVEPSRAVGLLLAGKAAMIGGTALAAGYAAVAIRYLPDLGAELPRERVLVATVVAVLSVGLAVAGRALERACQVPPDEDSGDAPDSGADGAGGAR
jgi:hypothetical protein